MSFDDFTRLLQAGGGFTVLAFAVFAFLRGWVIPASLYRDIEAENAAKFRRLEQDRDDWKEIALNAAGAADKAVTLAERRRSDRGKSTP